MLKGRHFDDNGSNMTALKNVPQNQFQKCFEGWTMRWHRYIASQGSTLKATMMVFSNEVCSNFTVMSSRTLLSDHVWYNQQQFSCHCKTTTCNGYTDMKSYCSLLMQKIMWQITCQCHKAKQVHVKTYLPVSWKNDSMKSGIVNLQHIWWASKEDVPTWCKQFYYDFVS